MIERRRRGRALRAHATTFTATTLAIALVLAPLRVALAQNDAAPGAPRADNRARAQQLFDSALADAEAGDFAAACPKFLASQEADPKTSTLLNLGACYEKNGQTASAWGAFREAEVLARKIGRADWEANARAQASALEPKLVRLTIAVAPSSRVPGLTVTRDGIKISAGEWGVAIPVDPGEHTVAATAEGREPWETKTSVKDRAVTVDVPLLAETPRPPAPAPLEGASASPASSVETSPPPSWWTPLRTAGVIGIGVGGAALVTGTVLGVVAKSDYDDARAKCPSGTTGCEPGAASAADSAFSLAGAATGTFIVGAVVAAAGIAVVVLAPSPKRSVHVGLGSVSGTW